MITRIHNARRCAAIFLILFGVTFATALLVGPAAHFLHWINAAEYAAGVSLTAMLLDALMNLTGREPLFPSMLLTPCPIVEQPAEEGPEWEELNHRRELLAARLQCDQPCVQANQTALCSGWPFCGKAPPDVIAAPPSPDHPSIAQVRLYRKPASMDDPLASLLRGKWIDQAGRNMS